MHAKYYYLGPEKTVLKLKFDPLQGVHTYAIVCFEYVVVGNYHWRSEFTIQCIQRSWRSDSTKKSGHQC
jgi:hypothetical protein